MEAARSVQAGELAFRGADERRGRSGRVLERRSVRWVAPSKAGSVHACEVRGADQRGALVERGRPVNPSPSRFEWSLTSEVARLIAS